VVEVRSAGENDIAAMAAIYVADGGEGRNCTKGHSDERSRVDNDRELRQAE